jgi:hypothetical protein
VALSPAPANAMAIPAADGHVKSGVR